MSTSDVDQAIVLASTENGNLQDDAADLLLSNPNHLHPKLGLSPLTALIWSGNKNLGLIAKLVNSTDDLDACIPQWSTLDYAYQLNALQLSADTDNLETMELLLNAGADPNVFSAFGLSALHMCHVPACIDTLVSFGAEINLHSSSYSTCIHSFLERSNLACAQSALQHGAKFYLEHTNESILTSIATGASVMYDNSHVNYIDQCVLALDSMNADLSRLLTEFISHDPDGKRHPYFPLLKQHCEFYLIKREQRNISNGSVSNSKHSEDLGL